MTVSFGLARYDVEFGCSHASAADLVHLEFRSGLQALEDMHQRTIIGAGVD
jgi:hypothetical protein